MIEYKEVKISRILNPTGIDLGEYVINPFMGCEYSCLYCYVRSNKVISKRSGEWGKYVDIRINAPDLLEKEILAKKPKCVLLGSTTDCFQPIETKYMITKRILEILNKHKVYYHILTRSQNITEYTDLLKQGFCKKIYFTINNITPELKNKLEPKSPGFELRVKAINKMLDENIAVVPYFSPILPWISDFKDIFSRFPKSDSVEFEGLNMTLVNINDIISGISSLYPVLRPEYEKLLKDKTFYDSFWASVKKDIIREAIKAKKNYNIYIHNFRAYFTNKYAPGDKREK
ncbi:MAG: radical SAM protein [Candidatus Omnitrophica bacterium]|nr:radical SAM protein [Candidatus Omnitrophota bacterium]